MKYLLLGALMLMTIEAKAQTMHISQPNGTLSFSPPTQPGGIATVRDEPGIMVTVGSSGSGLRVTNSPGPAIVLPPNFFEGFDAIRARYPRDKNGVPIIPEEDKQRILKNVEEGNKPE